MIKASEARTNTNNFEIEQYNKIKQVADEVLETIGKSIEFHSKNGFEVAEFVPYDRSRFTSYHSLQVASEIFERVLKDNGYEIVKNDWTNNVLKVKW
jgi:hypothetical protein